MKTNKILLFLVSAGFFGGNVVAMKTRGNKRAIAIKKRDSTLSAKQNGNHWYWRPLICLYNLSSVSLKDVKSFIHDKKLNIREKDSSGRTAIRVVAEEVACLDRSYDSSIEFSYMNNFIELFEMLLRMNAVTKEDIKDGVEELSKDVVCPELLPHYGGGFLIVLEGKGDTLLRYIMLKMVCDEDPFGFKFCEKLLSRKQLFELEDLNVIRVWLGNEVIKLIKCISKNNRLDWGKKMFRWISERFGGNLVDCNHELNVSNLEGLRLFEECNNPKDVVAVASRIAGILRELGVNSKQWCCFRPVYIFELVDDLIAGVSKNKEIEIQDLREKVSFLRDTANQQVAGQEEEEVEQDRGVRGNAFDIRFIDGKLLRVPGKCVFLSQK